VELRTRDYSAEDRKRLGDALTARRVAVSPAWANRAEFIRATGISKKLAERLETGQAGNFRTSTLAVIAQACRVTLESIAATLDGGSLIPAAEPRPAEDRADATVSVLEGALSAGERYIMASDLDPEFAAELVKAWREHGIDELIRLYAEGQRRTRHG
jgi:transcriptional regulator with XRE-family HTH domain